MIAVRRLAAILAADVVGYSRLMGQDELAPRRQWASGAMPPSRWWPNGDGVLLEFPSIVAAVEMRDGSIIHTTMRPPPKRAM